VRRRLTAATVAGRIFPVEWTRIDAMIRQGEVDRADRLLGRVDLRQDNAAARSRVALQRTLTRLRRELAGMLPRNPRWIAAHRELKRAWKRDGNETGELPRPKRRGPPRSANPSAEAIRKRVARASLTNP